VIFNCEDPAACWESACKFPPWLLLGIGGRLLRTYCSVCKKVTSLCTVDGGGGGDGHTERSADSGGGRVGIRDLLEPRWSARRPIFGERTGGGLLSTCWCCWDCMADGGWWGKLQIKTLCYSYSIQNNWYSSWDPKLVPSEYQWTTQQCSQYYILEVARMMFGLEVCFLDRFLMSISGFLQAKANNFRIVKAASFHILSYSSFTIFCYLPLQCLKLSMYH
jgi:hypothetical protein